jgi:hypothetical protein
MWTVTEVAWPPVSGRPPQLIRSCVGQNKACSVDSDCGAAGQCGTSPRIAPNYNHPEYFTP